MQYIKNEDYEYIMQKYADEPQSIVGRSRFVRQDRIFDESTGLDGDVIIQKIMEDDEKMSHLSHPVRKAKALEFVLKNTRISCDSRDIFPAINSIDRPLNKTIIGKWYNELFREKIPDVLDEMDKYTNASICTIWPDFDHSVPDFDRLFTLGFSGILAEVSEKAVTNKYPEKQEFYDVVKYSYSAFIDFLSRLENLAHKTMGSEKLAKALNNLKQNPPSSFYEALLLVYIYFMISEHIDCLQVRSLSNIDRQLYGLYKSDLERGVTEEEIRTTLAYFFLQFTAIGNYWNQPVYLGGTKADGTTEINELSYLFLDVYDKMGIYNPKIQIKLAENTPKDFVFKALDMIRRGNNCIVFVCDETIRAALMNAGATEEEARLAVVKGCYEYSTPGSFGGGMNYFNLLKPLEQALHEGCDGVTAIKYMDGVPSIEYYTTFEKLYDEYKRILLYHINKVIETVNSFEDHLSYINPLSMFSGTIKKAVDNGKDVLEGGTKTASSVQFGFLADIVDSLTMLKKYVYDKKELTLSEFVEILDKNYEGHDIFRKKLLADKEKYGNNKEVPDSFAKDLTSFIAKNVMGRPTSPKRGGKWGCGFHVARMSYTMADKTASSANGRLIGEELSKNVSASMGQNRDGATAAILSATKIDATEFTSDAALDLGLLPSAVQGDDGLEAMYGLVTTFRKRGGHAIHINVFDAETLRDAQKHPEKYEDLQIRVCGWNVLWNNINKKEQDGFIRQAEGLV
ncbi:MAG: hypothetical protein IJX92_06420 [Clostridia bacterium]|nr:hypothetical protein [Clostridia bacterium]